MPVAILTLFSWGLNQMEPNYNDWTREQLLSHLQKRERKQPFKKTRHPRPFDFNSSHCRHVALQISYCGANYYGFSATACDNVSTIESHLFEALLLTKLVPSIQECGWSRCGRTDKGVSATMQTVSLWIRTKSASEASIPWSDVPAKIVLENDSGSDAQLCQYTFKPPITRPDSWRR